MGLASGSMLRAMQELSPGVVPKIKEVPNGLPMKLKTDSPYILLQSITCAAFPHPARTAERGRCGESTCSGTGSRGRLQEVLGRLRWLRMSARGQRT